MMDMSKLIQLKQIGTVAEYKQQFKSAMCHLTSLDPSLNLRWFTAQFTLGLRDDIRYAVRLQAPMSVTRAVSLVRILEEGEVQRPRGCPPAPTKHPPAQAITPAAMAAPRTEWPRRTGNDEFNRERQLRDFCQLNGLCFKCGDKYNNEYQCRHTGQLLTIEVGAFSEVLLKDVMRALELLEERTVGADCCQLSVHALAGMESLHIVRLRATVDGQTMLLLVDSGNTHTFVNRSLAERPNREVSVAPSVPVRVANGKFLHSDVQVLGLS